MSFETRFFCQPGILNVDFQCNAKSDPSIVRLKNGSYYNKKVMNPRVEPWTHFSEAETRGTCLTGGIAIPLGQAG
jgi:hypothetical protein